MTRQSTIYITGVNGFVGKHLVRQLSAQGIRSVGVGREQSPATDITDILSDYYCCDLTNRREVAKLSFEKANALISLAGLANVGDSFNNADLYGQVNVSVIDNVCDVYLEKGLKSPIIAVSTGGVYDSNQQMPLAESAKLCSDSSPYVMSKIKMEHQIIKHRINGLNIIIARPFNHFGPDQNPGFILPDLYYKLLSARKTGYITVGNLNTRRDYTDVRDVVRAYSLLALAKPEQLKSHIYNICSGVSHSGEEILKQLFTELNIDSGVNLRINKDLFRRNDPVELIGNNSQIKNDTGWKPAFYFEKTIVDFVNNAGLR